MPAAEMETELRKAVTANSQKPLKPPVDPAYPETQAEAEDWQRQLDEWQRQEVLLKQAPATGDPDRQDYLVALVQRAEKFPDAEWFALAAATQAWANDGIRALRAKLPVVEFPAADAASDEVDAMSATTEEATPRRTRKAVKKAVKKVAKKAVVKAPSRAPAPVRKRAANGGGSKLEIIRKRLTGKQGTTRGELCDEIGWKSISMQQQAAALGLKLTVRKGDDGVKRYYGTPA
jgi:hypothetical protein